MTKWLISTGKFDLDEPTCKGKSAIYLLLDMMMSHYFPLKHY